MSDERLQLNLLAAFERGTLPDVTIVAQGREVRAHKVILAAQSEFFCRHFATPAGAQHPAVVELRHRHKVVQALVRFLYFAGLSAFKDLDPIDCLELLLLAEELGVGALDSADIAPAIIPPKGTARGMESQSKLTPQTALQMLQHEGLRKHPAMRAGICEYVGDHLVSLLKSMPDRVHGIPADMLPSVLKAACRHIQSPDEAQNVIQFCLGHTQLESACDLLRDTKQWNWGGVDACILRAPPGEEPGEGLEWTVRNVKHALEATPARIVVGEFFDWSVRLDYGAEGRLRLVYESTVSQEQVLRGMNNFPAATFAWRVVFRGQDVFNEKPVFICFPEGVQLHWSTTLPVNIADLSDDDDLRIIVNMAENPMLSLILYYFASDLKRVMETEDILNRLPHIEYRCLSSYSLIKSHS